MRKRERESKRKKEKLGHPRPAESNGYIFYEKKLNLIINLKKNSVNYIFRKKEKQNYLFYLLTIIIIAITYFLILFFFRIFKLI